MRATKSGGSVREKFFFKNAESLIGRLPGSRSKGLIIFRPATFPALFNNADRNPLSLPSMPWLIHLFQDRMRKRIREPFPGCPSPRIARTKRADFLASLMKLGVENWKVGQQRQPDQQKYSCKKQPFPGKSSWSGSAHASILSDFARIKKQDLKP